MWSSAGSVGIANSSDLNELLFAGSIAQLGVGIGGATGSLSTGITDSTNGNTEKRIGIQTKTATLRYPIYEANLSNDSIPAVYNLTLRYRDGNGNVNVQLLQVEIATGTETAIVNFQSGVGFTRSDSFHNQNAQGTFGLDFEKYVYCVAVTLAAPSVELGVAPAIQLMQLDLATSVTS